ncbi:hypothetical protein LCGC14_0544310 [marine sediment metagenome]|uniref:ParB/Sulfiredoxin domain-containing protein n=1 Tax=marine sediment metagenome TaxID=412755 RepID=A0A0F9RWI6_9ZZZZ
MATHCIFVKKDKNGIRMTIEKIPLHKLKLDPNNVRFRHIKEKLHDDEMEDLVWSENDTKKLYQSILASGGLSEKPFVSLKNVVYEGNRRVVCLRKIIKNIKEGELKDVNSSRFNTVECEMPIDDIAPLEIDILKARWHVSGKKEWSALNRAGHVYDLYHNRGLSYEEIQAYVQMNKNQVFVHHRAYQLTVEYMEAYPDDADIKRFSYFAEVYCHRTVKNWIEEDERNKELFFEWIHDKKFDDLGSSDTRNFRFILPNKLAMKEFTSKTGTYTSAMKIV